MNRINKTVAYLIMLMATCSYTIHTSTSTIDAANLLINASYSSPEIQKNLLSFVHKDITIYSESDMNENLPSIDEIVSKVSNLQNKHGFIENLQEEKAALQALQAAVKATDKVISFMQIKNITDRAMSLINTENKNDTDSLSYHLLMNSKIIEYLKKQRFILQNKINQLEQKATRSYFTNPSLTHIAIGVILTSAITGGIYYLYDITHRQTKFFTPTPENESSAANLKNQSNTDSTDNKNNQDSTVYLDSDRMKAKDLLNDFFNNTSEKDINTFVKEAIDIKSKLDPVKDKYIIEAFNIFIDGQSKVDIGVVPHPFLKNLTKEQQDNHEYWKNIYNNRNYYADILSNFTHKKISSFNLGLTFGKKMPWKIDKDNSWNKFMFSF